MPVRFTSDHDTFITFRSVAVQLIKLSGHSGTIPGAIPADRIGDALESLRAGVARLAAAEQPPMDPDDDESADEPAFVSITQRAYPLIQLMTDALASGSGIRFADD